MPKDELDPEDPMELFGVGILTTEDTTLAMTECFVEEFMRLGYNHKQILALFRNPYYTGMNMVLENKGEPFVREIISESFAKWGRPVRWAASNAADQNVIIREPAHAPEPATAAAEHSPAVDPMGNVISQEILDETRAECHSGKQDCTCGKKSK